MMTGKEYLKKHVGETNIPEEHYENEIGEMMDWYADDYHQEKVKNLALSDVMPTLVLFADWLQYNGKYSLPEQQAKDFLKEQQEQN